MKAKPGAKVILPGVIRGYQKPRGAGWYVIYPAGSLYAGKHTFATKREARAFVMRGRLDGAGDPEVKA